MFCGMQRRDFLQVGVVGGLGLTLGDFFRQQATAAPKSYETEAGTAKSIIYIFLPGGIAHQESFDPKPYAPIEYRGPYGVINTNVDGVQFNELWKNTAQVADKLAVVRSMTHGEAAHERGTHNMFTGYRPSPALQYPSMGSVVAHEFGLSKQSPPLRLHSQSAECLRRHGLFQFLLRRVQPRIRPSPTTGSRCGT
jgi:hypothetical protein